MKKKIIIILLCLVFLYFIGGVIYSLNIKPIEEKKEEIVLNIEGYNYSIKDTVNKLYKDEFNVLKNNLESKNILYDEYIKSIAKLYIIDLYSLNDKLNKYDVSSIQFVKESSRENFKLKVSETLYKYIEDKSDGFRSQELPIVSEIIIESVNETTFIISEEEYKAYDVLVSWDYDIDLGYPQKALLTLIDDGNIICVVSERRPEIMQ